MTATAHACAGPAHDLLRHARGNPLDALFAPKTIAIIGASEKPGSAGRTLAENLRAFEETTYLVNPNHKEVLGAKTFPDIVSLPEKVDLAVIATPAPTVPGLIRECAKAGVAGAVIISAGFKECGTTGAELERQILAEARRGRLRLIGPNCLGVMAPHARLNATFAEGIARPGNVAFISQSGALCAAVLDWSLRENVGFSAFVSVGSMLDVGWGDLITYFGDDPHTKSIVCYMESVGDARAFLSAAREVALTKPIIVLKVGHTEAAAKAAASHTGALTGSDAVLDAAFRRVGVLRVETIEELFDMAEVLAKQPRPHGPRLAMVTNAGGPGALATDALVFSGGQVANLSPATTEALSRFLPPHWSHGNPIDLLGDADAERYAKAVALAAKDPNTDGVLVVLTPQAMTDATATAERLKTFAKLNGKPMLASWMGGAAVDAGEAILNHACIPTFKYPDRAARAFALMWRYSDRLRALYETPTLPTDATTAEKRSVAENIIQAGRKAGRTLLTEVESKQVLDAYGIKTVETHVAFTENDAVKRADELGYAIALMALILWTTRAVRRIRREEAAKLPPGTLPRTHKWAFRPFEYRSKWTLLSLPLLHIRMECQHDGKTLPARGWIAVGKLLMAGADVTMLCSVLMRHGIDRMGVIEQEMVAWMQEHEYESVEQLKGSLSHKNCPDPSAFERAQYMRAVGVHKVG